MNLLCCGFKEFANRIREKEARIVMFGAGAIGRVSVPEILKEHDLLDSMECYVDNDEKKWGKKISVCCIDIPVRSPEYLKECPQSTAILINISRFSAVISQLEAMECTGQMDCYIMPMMLIHNYCMDASAGKGEVSDTQLIPKKFHYMWFGGKHIPENLKKCIDSWRLHCPDYEIIEWNENNYDINKHPYMKQAYEAGAYGFVPDYARLDILYNEGGLYLDTDVELKRNIDDLLFQEAFCGVEKWQIINFGGLSGAVKGHPMIRKFLDARTDILFTDADGNQNRNTCGYYDTGVAIREGYKINGKTQSVCGMNIYAYDYFHPYDYMSGIINDTDNTYSVHWFNGGWLDDKMRKANEEAKEKYLRLYRTAVNGQEVI